MFLCQLHTLIFSLFHLNPPVLANCVVFRVSALPRPHRVLCKRGAGACVPKVWDQSCKTSTERSWVNPLRGVSTHSPPKKDCCVAFQSQSPQTWKPLQSDVACIARLAYMSRSQRGQDQIPPWRNWDMQSFTKTVSTMH